MARCSAGEPPPAPRLPREDGTRGGQLDSEPDPAGQPGRRGPAEQLRGLVLAHRPPAPLAFQQVLIPTPGVCGVKLPGQEGFP